MSKLKIPRPNPDTTGTYRRDIDGLRGVAVVAVVLYHADIEGFSGGSVGVDVFFVVSGFLITQLILRELEAGSFSVFQFYERRVRRIFPGLIAVLFFCVIASYLVLLPADIQRFSESLIASTACASNIYFWRHSGYFDTASRQQPLLHLWSLSVEEQFYILFPIILVVLRNRKKQSLTVLLGLALTISFGLSVWGLQHPGAAFYLLPTRAWELLAGTLLAEGGVRNTANRWVANLFALAGMLGIVWSIAPYSEDMWFPRLGVHFTRVFLSCGGTSLLIYSNTGLPTLVARCLSTRLLAGIGLISYSLYLWHWPLIVFVQYFLFRPLTNIETMLIVLAAFAVAALSWKFIERPFRKRDGFISSTLLFATCRVSAIVLFALGLMGFVNKGFPQWVPQQVAKFEAFEYEVWTRPDLGCITQMSAERVKRGDLCRVGPGRDERPDFIVWGDSHAYALMPAFKAMAEENGIVGWYASFPACAPLVYSASLKVPRGIYLSPEHNKKCVDFDTAMEELIEQRNIQNVVLVAFWQIYSGKTKVRHQFSFWDTQSPEDGEQQKAFESSLRRTVSRLTSDGRQVYLILDVPFTNVSVPQLLARKAKEGLSEPKVLLTVNDVAEREYMRRLSEDLVRIYGVRVIDPAEFLCKESRCLVATEGHPLFVDNNHVSKFGALYLKGVLHQIIDKSSNKAVLHPNNDPVSTWRRDVKESRSP